MTYLYWLALVPALLVTGHEHPTFLLTVVSSIWAVWGLSNLLSR